MINVKAHKLATIDRRFWYAWQRNDTHLMDIRHVRVTMVHASIIYKDDGTTATYGEKIDTDQVLGATRNDLYNNPTALAKAMWLKAVENYSFWCSEHRMLVLELGELCNTLSEPPASGNFGNQRKMADDLISRLESMYRRKQIAKDQCVLMCGIMARRIPFPDFRDQLQSHCDDTQARKDLLQKLTNEYEKHLHRLAVRGFAGRKEDK